MGDPRALRKKAAARSRARRDKPERLTMIAVGDCDHVWGVDRVCLRCGDVAIGWAMNTAAPGEVVQIRFD